MTSEPADDRDPAIRLESGELLRFETCPCPLPLEDDLDFLRSPAVRERTFFDVGYDPITHRLSGLGRVREVDAQRLQHILGNFSCTLTDWIREFLPCYADHLIPDQVMLSVHEEATRSLRHSVRNDLLHLDASLTRPTHGKRILQFSLNLNTEEDRVWATSMRFAEFLEFYQKKNRVPMRSHDEWSAFPKGWQRFLLGAWTAKPAYDTFMTHLAEFCKFDEEFHEHATRRYHHFAPGSAWMLFSDGLSHAVLRGAFALEHTFYLDQSHLLSPGLSPLEQLIKAGSATTHRQAG